MTLLFVMRDGSIRSRIVSDRHQYDSIFTIPKCFYDAKDAIRVIWLEGRKYLLNRHGPDKDVPYFDFGQDTDELHTLMDERDLLAGLGKDL